MQRLFFALWPDAAMRRHLASVAAELGRDYRARWVRPQRYHLTLCFVAEDERFSPARMDRLAQAVACVHAPAFVWHPDRVASFPARRPPCIVHASRDCAALLQLRAALRSALVDRGIRLPEERRFRAHVTLGYGLSGRIEPRALPVRDWRADAFVLLHSVAGQRDYRELGRWPLSARLR